MYVCELCLILFRCQTNQPKIAKDVFYVLILSFPRFLNICQQWRLHTQSMYALLKFGGKLIVIDIFGSSNDSGGGGGVGKSLLRYERNEVCMCVCGYGMRLKQILEWTSINFRLNFGSEIHFLVQSWQNWVQTRTIWRRKKTIGFTEMRSFWNSIQNSPGATLYRSLCNFRANMILI